MTYVPVGEEPVEIEERHTMTLPRLDDAQQRAVNHGDGPMLVLAGPGTGKTRVLTERVARLIEAGAVSPENLLVLTFSRRAAREMRERIHQRLKISYSSFFIATFHSLSLSIVTRNYHMLGYTKRPSLLTSEEQWARIASMMRTEQDDQWIYYLGLRHMRSFVQQVFDFILRAQERLLTADDVVRIARNHQREDWLEVAAFMHRYQDSIRGDNFVDYGGMVEQATRLLRDNAAIRTQFQEQYTHILVDEYQDTNPGQDELLSLLAGERKNLFVVGDPDQSIYGFRGATISNILQFSERYGTEPIKLQTNYRAAPALVNAGNTLIQHNRISHVQRTLRSADSSLPAHVVSQRFDHSSDELEFIAQEARRLHIEEGVPFSEMSVLVRSIRRLGAGLDGVFTQRGIPHRILGGSIRLYDHPYVRPMLGLLRLAAGTVDPEHDITFTGEVLASQICDLDPLVVRAFQREARQRARTMIDVMEHPPRDVPIDETARERIDAFLGLIEALRDAAAQTTVDVLAWKIWDTLPSFGEVVARDDRGSLGAIREFYAQVVRFTERHPVKGNLTEFLALDEAGDLGEDPWLTHHDDGADAVKVMTIHQAKGLEFDVVFIPGLVDGAFPNLTRPAALFDTEIFAGRSPQTREHFKAEALEEERRVAYVGLTRARSRAYLSAVDDEQNDYDRPVSRFLKELDPAVTAAKPPRPARTFLSMDEAICSLRRTLSDPQASATDQAVAALVLRDIPGASAGIWGDLRETTNPLPLFENGRLPKLSYSSLSKYENCPQMFLYDRELSLERAEGDALGFGSFIHSALEEFLGLPSDQRTKPALLALGEKHFDSRAFRYTAMAHQHRREMHQILENFWAYAFKPDGRHYVEHPFEFELGGVLIRGKIDRVDVVPEGLELFDYKTGRRSMTQIEAEDDLQLALYYLAALLDPDLAQHGPPVKLEYLYVGQLVPKGNALVRRGQTIGENHRAVVEQRILGLIDGLRSEAFDWSPTAHCGYCSYKTLCNRYPQGRDLPL